MQVELPSRLAVVPGGEVEPGDPVVGRGGGPGLVLTGRVQPNVVVGVGVLPGLGADEPVVLRYIYILIFFSCMRFPPPPQIAVLSLIRTGNTSSHLVARVVGYEVEDQLEVPPVHGVDEVAEVVKVAEQRVDLRKGNIGIRAIFPNVRSFRGNKSLQRTSKVSIFLYILLSCSRFGRVWDNYDKDNIYVLHSNSPACNPIRHSQSPPWGSRILARSRPCPPLCRPGGPAGTRCPSGRQRRRRQSLGTSGGRSGTKNQMSLILKTNCTCLSLQSQ